MSKAETKTKNTETKAKKDKQSGKTGVSLHKKETAKKPAPKTATKAGRVPRLSVFTPKRLRKFLRWLTKRHHAQGGVTEIRALADKPSKRVWSAYIDPDHVPTIVDLLRPADDGPRGKLPYGEHPRDGEANFYFTLNPANPALLARSAYVFGSCQATSDADIVAYSLLPIDIDATRAAGISSTDEEKEAAWAVVRKVRKFLGSRGVKPLVADSGNGYHLLIPTTPYTDVPAAAAKAHQLLKLLDQKFSTAAAKVDTTVHNPARIFKLYGTKAVKGSSMANRPHRYANTDVSEVPAEVDLFAIFKDDLAAATPAAKPVGVTKPVSKNGKAPASSPGWDFETSVKVLQGVLDRSGLPYKVVQKDADQGRIFAFKDCPHHTDPDGDHYECSVMVKPDGKFAGKCYHDETAGWKDMKPLIGWEEYLPAVKAELGLARVQYRETPHGLVWMKTNRDGDVVPTPLTNYTARILRTTIEDDGEERRTSLLVAVNTKGREFTVRVPASEFAAMNWVMEHVGASAILSPGNGIKDQVRHAIQVLSGDPPLEISHAHTGWCTIDGRPVYLHAGGGIGSDGPVPGVIVTLTGPLARIQLPTPPTGIKLRNAILASLKVLDLAPIGVTAPLFAGVYRAPLGAADFSLYYCGPTGNGKTVFTSLGQQHWGPDLDFRRVPANWSSTVNANEGLTFQAKDAPLLIDDFAPGSTAQDASRLHRDADRLFRNAGNGTGRGRMRADSSIRPTKYPRGLIIATGEDVPKGQSVRARLLVVEMSPGILDWEKVTAVQKDADRGRLAAAMAGYVQWLAGRYDEVMKAKAARVAELRDLAKDSGPHRRTPGIVAELRYGVELFCDYAVEMKALTAKAAEKLCARVWAGLGAAAAAQPMIQASGEPAQRFLDLLASAIASGEAHVADVHGSEPPNAAAWGWQPAGDRREPRGKRAGWVVKDDLYLEPEASYAVAQRMVAGGSDPLQVGNRTLHKRLHEQGKLVAVDKKRNRLTVRRTIGQVVREVLCLRPASLGLQGESGDATK